MPFLNQLLEEFCLLTEEETCLINEFYLASNEISTKLEKNEKKLAYYKGLYNLSNKGNLYSLLDSRRTKVEKEIIANQSLLLKITEDMDLGLLIRSAIFNVKIATICMHPLLNKLWDERWHRCGTYNQPQQNIPSFDLLKSLLIYSHYKKLCNQGKQALELLEFTAQLGHFASLNAIATHYLQKSDDASNALLYATLAAQLYWTPGYLLLCVVNLEKGQYQNALINLMVAEKLIPYSIDKINLAYQGKDLEIISTPLLKQLNAQNWIEAKLALAKLAGLPTPFVINILYARVNKRVDEIIAQESLDTSTLESEEEVSSGLTHG